ncbi:hypothetical protein HNR46_001577 [Haloferula luteola]|uniref:Uncharacterized protein n=1 Tax=Haloferula luteola TaxID=595692 RepID=A0A840VEU6_9BACT|nr:hypothetical protein [Haloferula luteola]MBB5351341.1 hypothetical protein [Haloferula luteola]
MATWTIKGEAGKAVDETARSLADVQAEGVEPEYQSLASDRLAWRIWLDDPVSATILVPDLGQKISLWRDDVRQFDGWVTTREIDFDGENAYANIVVEGPWWWLSKTPLSSEVEDQTDSESERTQFVLATASPRTWLIALIARAVALGCPIREGSIASVFTCPRLSLRNIPISEAISEVMRWVADGIVYFDYTVEGYPALCMQRRPAAATLTITPGQTVVPLIRIRPRLDLELEQVEVLAATRTTVDNKRATTWTTATAGVVTSALPKRQLNLVSGPEIDTWLPQDFTDSVVVRSLPFSGNGGELLRLIEPIFAATSAANPGVGPFYEQLGAIHINVPGIKYLGPDPANSLRKLYAYSVRMTDTDGGVVPASFTHFLTKGDAQDWWAQAGIEYKEVVVSAIAYSKRIDPDATPERPEWAELLGADTFATIYGGNHYRYDWKLVSGRAIAVKTSWPADTTLIRPEDYAFVNPPEGLADNLLSTQNWLPWEGTVSAVQDADPPSGHPLGSAMNIAGFRPETANMRALISGYSYSIATGKKTYRLGSPLRHAYRDLVNRFRASGNDNIVWLVDSVSGDPGENPPPDPELEIPSAGEFELIFGGEAVVYSGSPISFTED